ncbi:chromosomal replication initiator protein DnaA [Candidatus Fermentibacteria bacterium]|nr:chromosomal replication initiator protein DnaA [Candidatus Fermentibacteria bacterium]
MSDLDPESLWGDVLHSARENLSPSSYRTWLADSSFEAFDDSRFVVRFPNEFVARWAKAHYGEVLEESLRSCSGRSDLSLVCVGDPARPKDRAPTRRKRSRNSNSYLHPSYTFDNFVAGSSNELAHAGALAVAQELGNSSYNPLFIYGGVGLGKTHLIQAVAHYVQQNQTAKTFKYLSSEQFTHQVVSAIRNGPASVTDFRSQYMKLDLLLMDDIQFLANKERTQVEFFHRFNELYQNGRQIVLTSDRPPNEIKPLEERLVSRFESGLVADIQPPEFEMRLAILELKVRDEGVYFPSDVLSFIASTIKSNVRQLEGAVHRLAATSRITGRDVNIEMARKVISDFLGSQARRLTPGSISSLVAEEFSISPTQLKGKGRKRDVLIPRQVAMFLIRDLTSISLSDIGSFFSGRDHSTVLNSIERIKQLCEEDSGLRRKVEEVRNRLTR